MSRFFRTLILACCIVASGANADDDLGPGELLVATELVGGLAFAETVILLLSYDENGALGLVVNRRTEAKPAEVASDVDGIEEYEGSLFFGGPVQMHTLRVLLHTKSPPAAAVQIFGNIYLGRLDESLVQSDADESNMRFYIGYAGWAPEQLEQEMVEGSWNIVTATEDIVFADDPEAVWKKLLLPDLYRVSR